MCQEETEGSGFERMADFKLSNFADHVLNVFADNENTLMQ